MFRVPVGRVTLAFQILVLTLPVVVGLATHRLMRRLRDSGASDLLHLPLREVVARRGRATSSASPPGGR